VIADIEDKPEGMTCEANAHRVLKKFKGIAWTQVLDR
jgi:hypothetical protein